MTPRGVSFVVVTRGPKMTSIVDALAAAIRVDGSLVYAKPLLLLVSRFVRVRGATEVSFSDLPRLSCKTPPFSHVRLDACAR
jgi:hypothetical protein